jgi:HK97 family phage prohead protease
MRLDIRGDLDIIDKSSDDRVISGYASVCIVDSEDELIPIEALSKGIESLFEDDGIYANLMLVHQNIQIGKILKSYKEFNTHIDEKGLYVVAQIRKKLKVADEIWEKIINGTLRGFSIGAEIIKRHTEQSADKLISIIDKLNIFEVSLCFNPTNSKSNFSVITKSKAEELGMYVRNDISKGSVDMVNEPIKEAESIPKIETTISLDDRVKALEDKILSITTFTDRIIALEGLIKPSQEQPKIEKSKDIPIEDINIAIKARDEIINGYELKIKELELKIKELGEKELEPKTTITKEEYTIQSNSSNLIKDGSMVYKRL